MLDIAKFHCCPFRLNFSYGDEVIYYDSCIRALKKDFSRLSISDKSDVVVNFILKGNLDAGSSGEFIGLIQPYYKSLFKHIETISDEEIIYKFNISTSTITNYRKALHHYKSILEQDIE